MGNLILDNNFWRNKAKLMFYNWYFSNIVKNAIFCLVSIKASKLYKISNKIEFIVNSYETDWSSVQKKLFLEKIIIYIIVVQLQITNIN